MLIFHHSRPLALVDHGIVFPVREKADRELLPAYEWLEGEIGFFPLFLALGTQEWQLQMTGYQDQWRRLIGYDLKAQEKLYRRKGESPNYCLFSFHEGDIGEGVFIDESAWVVFICGAFLNGQPDRITEVQIRTVFKRSWPRSRWVREAKREDSNLAINLVVPALDLSRAARSWVRNKGARKLLGRMGFKNIQVKRLRVPKV